MFKTYQFYFDFYIFFRYNCFRIWRDLIMDENKNGVNGNTQNTNDINYSFDFANQVQDDAQKNEAPITPDSTVTVSDVPVDSDVVTSNSEVSSATVEMPVTQSANANGENMVTENANQVVDSSSATNDEVISENSEEPTASEIVPTTNEEDSFDLIKDKKETKRFLIILFVVILIFIIALPFIFNVAG